MQTSKVRNRFIAILLVMAFICSLWGHRGLGLVSADGEAATPTDATEVGTTAGSSDASFEATLTATATEAVEIISEDETSDEEEEEKETTFLDSELSLNFVVISGDRFDTPSSDNYIVLDVGEEGTTFDSAELTIVNEFTGVSTTLEASNIVDTSMLFMMNFSDDYYTGVYRIDCLHYFQGETEYVMTLWDLDTVPKFGVNVDADTAPDLVIDEETGEEIEETEAETIFDVESSDADVIDLSSDFSNANVIAVDTDDEDSTINLTDDENFIAVDEEFDEAEDEETPDSEVLSPVFEDENGASSPVEDTEPLETIKENNYRNYMDEHYTDYIDTDSDSDDTDSDKEEDKDDADTSDESASAGVSFDVATGISLSVNKSNLLGEGEKDDEDDETIISSKSPENVVIVLDPGHGGADSGAVKTWDGVTYNESEINQVIANACKEELSKNSNVTVYLTRSSRDEALHGTVAEDLVWRSEYAKSVGADLYVSLHCNSSPYSDRRGVEVYVPNSNYNSQVYNVGKSVGEAIYNKLKSLGISGIGVKTKDSENGTTYDDGSTADYYAVIRNCKERNIPGMIVEHAYLSNPADASTYFGTWDKCKALGKADAQAIATKIGLLQENRSGDTVKKAGWRKSGDTWVYYDKDGNVKTGFFTVDDYKYYAKSNGQVVTGWNLIEGSWYYFNDSGKMYIGCWVKNKDGNWCYLKKDGKMATGVTETSDGWYMFNSDGVMLTGWRKSNGNWYYMNDSGKMLRSSWISSGGYWYYLGSDGKMKTGIFNDGGTSYYAYSGGEMVTGWAYTGSAWVYATNSGALLKSSWLKDGGKWYYLGSDGKMKTGFVEQGGYTYYMYSSGAMATGWFYTGGHWYLALESGAVLKRSWYNDNGNWYYLDGDGQMVSGFFKSGGVQYYAYSSGVMVTGWFKHGNSWYYATDSGAVLKSSWYQWNGEWYYLSSDGSMVTDELIEDGKKYTFNSSGVLIKTEDYTPPKEEESTEEKKDDSNSTEKKSDSSTTTTTKTNTAEVTVENTNKSLYRIMGKTNSVTKDKLVAKYVSKKVAYPSTTLGAGGASNINDFCQIIIEESEAEGVRAEVVFAQIMNETGWLQFTGTVKASQFNFCGLGCVSSDDPGLSFSDVRTGIRAQVQHLKAYASTDSLKNTCVDSRFKYVTRGCAPYVEYLGINENPSGKGWAASTGYGDRLLTIITTL